MTHALGTHWYRGLTVVLGVLLAVIGLAAHGAAGTITFIGAAAVIASVVFSRRNHVVSALLLVAGAVLPLALTWWSIVTPVLAVLCLLLGWPRARAAVPGPVGRVNGPVTSTAVTHP